MCDSALGHVLYLVQSLSFEVGYVRTHPSITAAAAVAALNPPQLAESVAVDGMAVRVARRGARGVVTERIQCRVEVTLKHLRGALHLSGSGKPTLRRLTMPYTKIMPMAGHP
jgi:hypothetical protein